MTIKILFITDAITTAVSKCLLYILLFVQPFQGDRSILKFLKQSGCGGVAARLSVKNNKHGEKLHLIYKLN
jgi:hypothetical protein